MSKAGANTLLGWADPNEGPFTWFETALLRPPGRQFVVPLRLHQNPPGDPNFRTATINLFEQDIVSTPNDVRTWRQELQREDVIQLIPRTEYLAWVNIINEASITVEYYPFELRNKPAPSSSVFSHKSPFYTRKLQDEEVHDTIRILTVQPGAFDDPICGSFDYQRLDTSDQGILGYEALSYFWGPQSNRDEILIMVEDSEKLLSPAVAFNVSHTVTSAIQYLRCEDKPLKIWVVAICINQADLREREHQVNLMRSIYSTAKAVHIWLGEGECGSGPTLRAIRDAYNLNVDEGCKGGRHCSCKGSPHSELEVLKHQVQNQSNSSWHHLDEVFKFNKKLFSEEQTARDGGQKWHVWTMWILF